MASRKKPAWLAGTGRRYIIGAPKSDLKKSQGPLRALMGVVN